MLVAQNIERDLAAWRKQEEEIRKIFSPSVVNSRAFQLEKLRQLERIYYKHTVLMTGGGRQHDVLLKMLKMERDNLERRLYPNLLLRLLRRLIQPLKAIAVAKVVKTQRMESDQSLKDSLAKAGFGGINWRQVEQQVQRGEPSFSVSHTSEMIGGKRADYELSFVKDEQGRYQFDRYQASLKVDAHPEQNKKQVFVVDAARPTTAAQAFNLLDGRAIEQQYQNALGSKQTAWVKLDFTDKDNAGNFKRREWVSDMDAEKMVAGLPVKENANHFESSKLIDDLRNGERVSVTLVKDGKEIPVTMEVNPSTRNIDLYNANNKKVGLPEAFGDKKEKAPVVSLSPTTEEKQQRRNGMTIRG